MSINFCLLWQESQTARAIKSRTWKAKSLCNSVPTDKVSQCRHPCVALGKPLLVAVCLASENAPPGGGRVLYIFWVRGRAIGKGIDFHDFGIRNGIDFHGFGIRNGINFRNFHNLHRVGYAFSENWYKVGYTFWNNWYKERVCF